MNDTAAEPPFSPKPQAGGALPPASWPKVGGGTGRFGGGAGWQMLVVYRGQHCPMCRAYLARLDALLDEFQAAGIAVAAVSADPREKAEAAAAEYGWRFPVLYDLSLEDMRQFGLYMSAPRPTDATDRPFAEPALFALNPQGRLQIVSISNSPYSRPDLIGVLDGLRSMVASDQPIRGTMV